jgi:hypothetical protein
MSLILSVTVQDCRELFKGNKIICPPNVLKPYSEGIILVANNTSEFSRISGLKVENWAV